MASRAFSRLLVRLTVRKADALGVGRERALRRWGRGSALPTSSRGRDARVGLPRGAEASVGAPRHRRKPF